MNRVKLIQLLMKEKGLKNYLEIGVFNGHAFTYEDFNANRAQWINLKRPDYSSEYFKLEL